MTELRREKVKLSGESKVLLRKCSWSYIDEGNITCSRKLTVAAGGWS